MPTRYKREWDVLARLFKDSPESAYHFARALYLAQHELTIEQGIKIDDLIDALFPYTDFYKACHHLYWLAIKGRLHPNYYPPFLCKGIDPSWADAHLNRNTDDEK